MSRGPLRWVLGAILPALAIVYLTLAAAAAAEPDAPAQVADIADNGTIVLEGGGRVHLAGIQLPPPGWPHSDAAGVALQRLLRGRRVTLTEQAAADRHGRVHAHLHLEDGTWVQGALLEAGFARVHTTPASRGLAAEMLAVEQGARRRRAGLWRYDAYQVRAAEGDRLALGTFQVVEGDVVATARVGRRVYLNFGPDWRSDFTASIPSATLRAFRDAGLDPLGLEGRRVRVRGWIHLLNGPAIELTHPEQVEILTD